jgi:hypothetical protein
MFMCTCMYDHVAAKQRQCCRPSVHFVAHTHTHINTYTHTHIHTDTSLRSMRLFILAETSMDPSIHKRRSLQQQRQCCRLSVHFVTHTHTHIHTYTHTHTHTVCVCLFLLRRQWISLFTSDEGVMEAAMAVSPILCSFAVFDSMNGVLAGALRGCGKQKVAFVCLCVCVCVCV